MRLSKKPSEKGFTLLELMIGLAILGIVTALAAPSMSNMIGNGRISGISNDLATAMRFAKAESTARLTPVTICTSNAAGTDCDDAIAWREGWIVFTNAGLDNEVGDEDIVLRVQPSYHESIKTVDDVKVVHFLSSGRTNLISSKKINIKADSSGIQGINIFIGLNGRPIQLNAVDEGASTSDEGKSTSEGITPISGEVTF